MIIGILIILILTISIPIAVWSQKKDQIDLINV